VSTIADIIGAAFILTSLVACCTVKKQNKCLVSIFILLNFLLGAGFVAGGIKGHDFTVKGANMLGAEDLCTEGEDGEFKGVFTKIQEGYNLANDYFCSEKCPCAYPGEAVDGLATNIFECKGKDAEMVIDKIQKQLDSVHVTRKELRDFETVFVCSGMCHREDH